MQTLRFELRYILQQKSTWIYFVLLLLLSFLIVNIAGGMFESVQIRLAGDQTQLNSPFVISTLMSIFNMIGIVITANMVGNSVLRDFKHRSNELTFSSGIHKFQYLLPKFAAPFLINGILFLAVPLGILIASYMPYLEQDMFGPFNFKGYWMPLLTRVYPNTLFVGSVFFLLSILKKSTSINWVGIIAFYVLYGISQSLSSDIDNKQLTALLEPFGINATTTVTSTLSADEQNTQAIPLENLLLWNRILWSSVALVLLWIGYSLFSFSLNKKQRKPNSSKPQENVLVPVLFKKFSLPKTQLHFYKSVFNPVFYSMIKIETLKIIKSLYFKIILLLLIVLLGVTATQLGKTYDTVIYPVTYRVAEVLFYSSQLLLYLFVILFSGQLVWNSRHYKTYEIEDALPITSTSNLLSKFAAVSLSLISIHLVIWMLSIVIQYAKGYYDHEPIVFLGYLLSNCFKFILFTGFAFFVQSIVGNKYVGYFILVIWYLLKTYIFQALLQHNLLIPYGVPEIRYSDMNGFGSIELPLILFNLYWALFDTLLLLFAAKLYPRGKEISMRHRWKSVSLKHKLFSSQIGFVLIGMLVVGSIIFYNTNVLNQFEFSSTAEQNRVEFEKKYAYLKKLPQPKLTHIDLNAAIFPETQSINVTGSFVLKNKTQHSIDTVFIHFDKKTTTVESNSNPLQLLKHNPSSGLHLYQLNHSLHPQQELTIQFKVQQEEEGFKNNFSPGVVAQNGALIWNSILPVTGYDESYELTRNRVRKKHGLEERPIEKHRHDMHGIVQNGVSPNADQVIYHAVVSTSQKQTAFTSGNLIKQWEENGRNFFEYTVKGEMNNIYSFVSAEYENQNDVWHSPLGDSIHAPVMITVNHHSKHKFNIQSMIDAVKASMDYYTQNFGPYQHDLIRIMEFPRYNTMAVSFPNTIPFSESIGFIADVTDAENASKINYPFWVTAHEVAHQWWAHQLIPANVEGASFLTESLAQYSSVRVLEKFYGKDMTAQFLKNELQTYLAERNNDNEGERPLATVLNYQQHVFYNKGAIVLFALSEYIGEQKFNAFLANYLSNYKRIGPPYPTSESFVEELKKVTPKKLQFLIEDWLEKITLYNLQLQKATYSRDENLTYTIHLEINAKKFQNHSQKEIEIKMNESVEFGVYNSRNKEIYRGFLPIKSGKQTIELKLNRKPNKVIVDPRNLMIVKDWILNKSIAVKKIKS